MGRGRGENFLHTCRRILRYDVFSLRGEDCPSNHHLSMAALPPARRIVTGHSPQGKAIIESDTVLHPIDPHAHLPKEQLEIAKLNHSIKHENGGFILIFKTEGHPAKTSGEWIDYHGMDISLSDNQATTVRIVDMVPGMSSPMHRTASLDIGTVLSGEVVLELDDGVETIANAGDTIVQRATLHAWHNRTDKMARMSFVLIPGQPVVIDGEALEPTRFPVN